MCEVFGTLPVTGGLFNQPSAYVARMYEVLKARTAVEQLELEKQKAKDKVHKRTK